MKLDTFKCDVCGKVREKDSNRWWLIIQQKDWLRIEKFSTEAVSLDILAHICGEDCTLQMVQRWLATGSLDAPSQRPVSKPEGT